MNKITRWIVIGLVGIVAVIGAYLLSTDGPDSGNAATLRLGYRPKALGDMTPIVIQEAQLKADGLTIQLVPLSSPTDAMQKFAAGEIDAMAGIPLEPVFQQMQAGNLDYHAYALQVDKTDAGWVSFVGNKQAGVARLTDLAGKTVASLPTVQAQYLAKQTLLAAGIPEDQIKIVTYNPATPLLGFQSGEHAALFGLEPAISMATEAGHPILSKGPTAHYLYNDQPVPLSGSYISKQWVAEHPDAYEGYLGLVDEAIRRIDADPSVVRHYFTKAEYGGFSEALVQRFFLPTMVKPTAEIQTITQRFIEDLVADGQLKKSVDITDLFPKYNE